MNTDKPVLRGETGRPARHLLMLVPLLVCIIHLAGNTPLTPMAWAVLGVLALALVVGLLYGEESGSDDV